MIEAKYVKERFYAYIVSPHGFVYTPQSPNAGEPVSDFFKTRKEAIDWLRKQNMDKHAHRSYLVVGSYPWSDVSHTSRVTRIHFKKKPETHPAFDKNGLVHYPGQPDGGYAIVLPYWELENACSGYEEIVEKLSLYGKVLPMKKDE